MAALASEFSHHVLAEAVDRSLAGERHQRHLARLSRLETHGGAGGDVESHAARLFAIEFQRRVGLEEMIMRADLDRPVAAVGDGQRHRLAAGIGLDLAVLDEHLAGDHRRTPSPYPSWPGLCRPSTSCRPRRKAWMPATSAGMTRERLLVCLI